MSRATILISCSESLKEAVEKYARENGDVSLAEVARNAIIEYIGYDGSEETFTDKRKKYGSKEERAEAQKLRMRERRKVEKQLTDFFEHKQHLLGVQALESHLERHEQRG
jgi:hypothetical protein